MDVTCERCATEYEFDETLVSDRGTTVKCTNCGHLFKVFRPGAAQGAGTARAWVIRRSTGATRTLSSLRELQRLIAEGELQEEDHISRSGEDWKPLGAIAELQTFFAAARAGAPAARRDMTAPFDALARPDLAARVGASLASDDKTVAAHDASRKLAESTRNPAFGRPAGPASSSRPAGSASAWPTTPPSAPPSARPSAGPSASPSGWPGRRSPKGTIIGVGDAVATTPDSGLAERLASAAVPHGADPYGADPGGASGSIGFGQTLAAPDGLGLPGRSPTRPAPVTGSAATTTSERPAREPIVGGPIASRPIAPPPAAVRRAEHRTAPLGSDYDYAAAPAAPPFKKRGTSTRKDRDKPVARARPLYIDDADEVDRPRRRGWVGALIAVLLLGTVGTGAVLSWSRIAPMLGLADADPVARIIDAGDTHFARADEPGYREAVRQYTRATAVGENDVRAQTALTRAHGALAQLFSFQADDLEARAAADPTLAGDVAAARREQRSNAEDAARFGRLAVSLDANHVPALLAQADALRLTGDLEAAASSLGRATSLEPEPSAEQHYIAALMALSQRRDPAAARERAEAAVEAASGDLRARLLLARALLASADISGARRQIDAVLDLHEEHAGARALATAIEEGLPPAAPLVATLDGGVDAGSLDAGPAELPAEPAPTAAATSGGRAGSDSVDTSGCSDADCLVRRGADAQMRGDVGRARRYFEQALRLNPNELEANAGLGAIQLETGNVSGALPYLQRAAQANYSDSAILLGQAYRRLGRTEDARAAYQRYLDRNPGGTYAPAAMNALMALGPAPAGTDLPPGTGPSGPSTGDSPSGGGPSGGSPSPDPAGSPPGPGSPNTTPPSTSPNELPAPHGPDPANLPPASDPPSTDP